MDGRSNRRSLLATTGAGVAAALAITLPGTVSAAVGSAAGIVAGGSLAGTGGEIQFSAFGSRLEFDDGSEPSLLGALAWFDPAGLDGEPVTLMLAAVETYGPGDDENTRVLTGTLAVNGDGAVPFALHLVDNGVIGDATDSVHLAVGAGVTTIEGSDVTESDFVYEASGELTAGDVQIITFGA